MIRNIHTTGGGGSILSAKLSPHARRAYRPFSKTLETSSSYRALSMGRDFQEILQTTRGVQFTKCDLKEGVYKWFLIWYSQEVLPYRFGRNLPCQAPRASSLAIPSSFVTICKYRSMGIPPPKTHANTDGRIQKGVERQTWEVWCPEWLKSI